MNTCIPQNGVHDGVTTDETSGCWFCGKFIELESICPQ